MTQPTVAAQWALLEKNFVQLDPYRLRLSALVMLQRLGKFYGSYCASTGCSDPRLIEEVASNGWNALVNNAATTPNRFVDRLRTMISELQSKDDPSAIAQEACFGALLFLELFPDPRPEQAIRIMNFLR